MGEFVQHLIAAQGYIELEMFEAAADELEQIDPQRRELPAVLACSVAVYTSMENWVLAERAAGQMVKLRPSLPECWVHWAYSAGCCQSLKVARKILMDAEKLHPQNAMIQFHLGIYAGNVGDRDEAKSRLMAAITMDEKFRQVALDDPNLESLWPEIT